MLDAQNPINRPGWWEAKFALFQMPETGVGDVCPKADSPQPQQAGSESFYRQSRVRG